MNENNRWLWIAIVIIAMLLCLCTCCLAGGLGFTYWGTQQQTPTPEPDALPWPPETGPQPGETATPSPTIIAEPPPDEAQETLRALQEALAPSADIHELGIRFLDVSPDTSRIAATTSPDYAIGAERTFSVSNVDTEEQFEIVAVLKYKTDHVYMWVEKDVTLSNREEKRLEEAAELFEEHTYPTDREFFGSEWTPGVDSDPHLSILHARNLGDTVAGYFSSPDEYVRAVRDDSNEMEMFYINIENTTIGDDFYNGVLAHEFQHMIHWNNDRNETTWLNEGCSELAMDLNERRYAGHYDVGGSDISYSYNPDTQLTSWPEGTAGDASANYGAAYLFMAYFLDRFGEDATKALVAHPENSMTSVDLVLQENLALPLTHKEIFADWTVANLIDNPTLDEGQYGYVTLDPFEPSMDVRYDDSDYPLLNYSSTVHQYGVDYLEVESAVPLTFSFTGSTLARLINTEAHSGKYLWWSDRNDEADVTLTRVLDLREAQEAQVNFWAWYQIEENWDYGYVVVGSTEDGALPEDLDAAEIQWDILDDKTLNCTTTNPNSNAYGCGLTGDSDDWQPLSANLTPYTGKEIALRFEYLTDAAVNQPGLALDDIEITVDGEAILADDVEPGDNGWIAQGFIRHANMVPQQWIVQLVTFGGTPQVDPLLMADETSGTWTLPLGEHTGRAVLVISALAPVTTESAPYKLSLIPAE